MMKKTILTVKKNKEEIKFVEVSDEPMHKELYKNQYVRVYATTISPGTQTMYHRHVIDTIYAVIQGGTIRTQIIGNNKCYPISFPKTFGVFTKIHWGLKHLIMRSIKMPKDFFFFVPHKKQPIIHRAYASVNNLKDMIMIGIEVKKTPNQMNQRFLYQKTCINDFETDVFAVLRLSIKKGKTIEAMQYDCPGLIISLNDGISINIVEQNLTTPINKSLKCGEFLWYDCNTVKSVTNKGGDNLELLIIALK